MYVSLSSFQFNYPFLRRRKIKGLLYFLIFRVRFPSAVRPQGVNGFFLPIGARPSPPPCVCSLRFITSPLSLGRFPIHLFDPALPIFLLLASTFPICPIVA